MATVHQTPQETLQEAYGKFKEQNSVWNYVVPSFYPWVADGQMTFHVKPGWIDIGPPSVTEDILNDDGKEFYRLMKEYVATNPPVRAIIQGRLERERTGHIFNDSLRCLCTWNNLHLVGRIIENGTGTIPVGSPVTTSTVIFYEYNPDNTGWVYTKSGGLYRFVGEAVQPETQPEIQPGARYELQPEF